MSDAAQVLIDPSGSVAVRQDGRENTMVTYRGIVRLPG